MRFGVLVLKKIFLLLIIFNAVVFALNDTEIKLFEKLFTTLFQKDVVIVYSEQSRYKNLNTLHLKSVKNCYRADIVLGVSKYCKYKPHFLLNYYNYMDNSDAIGAFYWRKGRPQLRLRKKQILRWHLHISPEFKEFLE